MEVSMDEDIKCGGGRGVPARGRGGPHPFPIDDEDGVAHTLWAPTSPVRMMRGA
jgi:hypothetical protein